MWKWRSAEDADVLVGGLDAQLGFYQFPSLLKDKVGALGAVRISIRSQPVGHTHLLGWTNAPSLSTVSAVASCASRSIMTVRHSLFDKLAFGVAQEFVRQGLLGDPLCSVSMTSGPA
jgi:hypothetical protein